MKFILILTCCAAMCYAMPQRRTGQRQQQDGQSQVFLVPFNLDELDKQDSENGQPQSSNREQGVLSNSDLSNILRTLGFDGSNGGSSDNIQDNNQFQFQQRQRPTTSFSPNTNFRFQ